MKVAVVVGNPKPASRTLEAARSVAHAHTGSSCHVVDVIALGRGLLGWGDPSVEAAVEEVSSSDLVVFASPTFKATYAGILKLFLDQFAGDTGLKGVVVVPLMLGAGPAHAMAPDLLLKPVLVELGAIAPAPGLYLIDSSYTEDTRIADYVARWGRTLISAARANPS